MKLQAITMIAVITGFAGQTPAAEANDFIKVIRTINAIDRTVNGPRFGRGPRRGPIGKPIILPHPGPVRPGPPVCKPRPPVHVCPVCHHKRCTCQRPPINRPPVKKFTMKLLNNAETKVYFSLNDRNFQELLADDLEVIKSPSPKGHLIKYHNGIELVQYTLDPSSVYSFEWEGDTLVLLEIQG